jgi:nitroreductase
MTVQEAIAQRRSVRRFTPEPIPEDVVAALVEAVRLAPSGSNTQPWRIKLVAEPGLRAQVAEAANNQGFIASAPLVVVFCVAQDAYVEESLAAAKARAAEGSISAEMGASMVARMEGQRGMPRELKAANAGFNVGIAGEHLALVAVSLGLGSCWVRAFDERRLRGLLGLGEELSVIAIMPVGYPAESPPPRRRKSAEEILL